MAGKAAKLRFTKEETENPADHVARRRPKRKKLKSENDKAAERSAKLSFEKTDLLAGQTPGRGIRVAGSAVRKTAAGVSGAVHNRISQNNQDDNSAVEAANASTQTVETGASALGHAGYSRKLKQSDQAKKLNRKTEASSAEAVYQKKMAEADEISNPFSKWQQKQSIRKEYAAAKRTQDTAEQSVAAGSKAGSKAADAVRSVGEKLGEWANAFLAYVADNPQVLLIIGGIVLIVVILSASMTSCSAILPGGQSVIITTSYTADDDDITGGNADYTALETDLQNQVNSIETDYPGYDEYNYDLDEIGHDPYQLASYLTVLFEDYTRAEVQSTLRSLFDKQYNLDIEEVVETRYRTETRTGTTTVTDPETGEDSEEEYEYEVEVAYDYYILNVTLRNYGLASVIMSAGLDENQLDRYQILSETKGNKAELFAGDAYIANSDVLQYDIPGEALTDERFANMIREAEKYLGYPYVWGGASPSTSFDCSGFVSWVINHCGNGWNMGRLTANGLKSQCSIIPASAAKPGDLIFFQGTYDTAGASHVGIVVDPVNKVMIHCGNPIQYAHYDTAYWTQHFYCIGRLP